MKGREARTFRRALLLAAAGALLVVGWGLVHLHRFRPVRTTEVVLSSQRGVQSLLPGPDSPWTVREDPEVLLRALRNVERHQAVWVRYEGTGVWGAVVEADGEGRLLVPGKVLAFEPEGPGLVAVVLRAEPGARLATLSAGVYEPVPAPPPLGVLALLVALLASATLLSPALGRRELPSSREVLLAWLLVAVAVSFALAWSWYGELRLDEPEPDHVSYHQLAEGMAHPLDTGHREPLWIWVLSAWSLVAPATPQAGRFLGVLLVPLAVPATAFLAWELFRSRAAAGIAAGFIALQGLPALIAPMGLRAPLYLPLFAVTLGLCRRPESRRRWIALGIAGGLLCLLRMESLAVLALAFPLALWWGRPRPRRVAEAAVLFALLTAPMFLGHLVQSGDPLRPLSQHARWYAEEEPAVFGEAAEATGEAPPPQDVAGYLVRTVGPAKVIERWVRGFVNLFLNPAAPQMRMLLGVVDRPAAAWFCWGLILAGYGIWATGPHRTGLWLLLPALHLLPFFAAGLPEPRIFAHLLVLHACAVAEGVRSSVVRFSAVRADLLRRQESKDRRRTT